MGFKARTRKIKWAIVCGGQYVSGQGKAMAWTYDREEADGWARDLGGKVVDAEVFVAKLREVHKA